MGKTALIVADMLNDFLDPGGSLYVGDQAREIIPFVAQKIAALRAQGGVVIFVCDAHAPDDREFRYFAPHAVKGSWGARIIPELTLAAGDYRVEKTRYSAFAHTNLDDILRQEQVTEVQVVGVCTSICVMETVKELFDRDMPALVYRQGVADFDPEAHAFALKHMQRIMGARVVGPPATDKRYFLQGRTDVSALGVWGRTRARTAARAPHLISGVAKGSKGLVRRAREKR
jgi:nicotinamidase/pyrazinamidase